MRSCKSRADEPDGHTVPSQVALPEQKNPINGALMSYAAISIRSQKLFNRVQLADETQLRRLIHKTEITKSAL